MSSVLREVVRGEERRRAGLNPDKTLSFSGETGRSFQRQSSSCSEDRRYSSLLDLPDVNLDLSRSNDAATLAAINRKSTPWVDTERHRLQEKRFYEDFRPFFLLCQLSGMFPNVLSYTLPFSWCYWGSIFCLLHLIFLSFLFIFYVAETLLTIKSGLVYVSYNLAWVVHIAHSIEWIATFYIEKNLFAEIFQGYRKFYRYLVADKSDKSVLYFTWKTFIGWEVMFLITGAALITKSYYDRLPENYVDYQNKPDQAPLQQFSDLELKCTEIGYHKMPRNGTSADVQTSRAKRTVLATIDQLEWVQINTSTRTQNILFWLHLIANVYCVNVVFMSEVFFMVMVSIIFHAFNFIHKQIDGLLGSPDRVFNVNVIHDPMEDFENETSNGIKQEMMDSKGLSLRRTKSAKQLTRKFSYQSRRGGINLRTLWEQMEELIDLLEQINHAFGMTLQFLSLEYLLLFPALLYFCIELYPSLSFISLAGFGTTVIILGIRSFVFTSVCARVHGEAVAPISTLYRAYVKGDIPCYDNDLILMFINRISTTTIAVRTWSYVPITRQTFSIIFAAVFGMLVVLLQAQHAPII